MKQFVRTGLSTRIVLLFGAVLFFAFHTQIIFANEISQGYSSSTTLPPGTVVSLLDKSSGTVEPTNTENQSAMFGVVVETGDSLLELSSTSDNVLIDTAGPSQVLVTSQGGNIRTGDMLVASPTSGLAMRASTSSNEQKVLGSATADYDFANSDGKTLQPGESDGENIVVGKVPVYIAIGTSSGSSEPRQTSRLSQAVSNLTGKSVSNLQAIVGTLIFVVCIFVGTVVLFSGIKGSSLALGRNPLAKKTIFRSMYRIMATAILLVLFGSILSYLVFLI